MTYKEALEYISSSYKFGMKLGLDNIKKLLELLGNPEKNLKIIHVAGTNGKGSTCSFISNILMEFGYNVGLYTSPFLEVFNERIRINNENIKDFEIAEIIFEIKQKIDLMIKQGYDHPTEFEIVTAMAFYYYNLKNVDFVVLEVGLGGKYDATNVIQKSLASVITPISIDHINVLGDTIEQISKEKAGIIKNNGNVFVYNQSQEALNVIKQTCQSVNANLNVVDFCYLEILNSNIDFQEFNYKNYKSLKINLIGEHQIKNCVLAINVCEFVLNKNLEDVKLKNALLKTTWAGRIEKILKKPLFIIDGAHNEDGAKSLAKVLETHFKDKKLTLLIGMLKDKEVDKVLEILIKYFDKIVTTNVDNPRSIDSYELYQKILKHKSNVENIENVEEALNYVIKNSNQDDIIISCGSLYLIGQIRSLLKGF